jgi:U3 small nucleolar ribonucleoprotein protein IMP4
VINKTIITTSRRPTPVVRRFIKYLIPFIPNAQYQRRGKLTFTLLVLQAIDFNADKIIVVRNRKGDPGYLDVYQVNYANKALTKLCTLYICGYSIDKNQTKLNTKQKIAQLLTLDSTLALIDNEDIAECLLTSFNIKICNEIPKLDYKSSYIHALLDIKKYFKKMNFTKLPVYEITFKNLRNEFIGPVIRICKAKMYTKVT